MTKFMLLTNYGEIKGVKPMTEWSSEEVNAHFEYLHAVNRELIENGELTDAQALSGPEQAKLVTSDGKNTPMVTDGPFPEYKELLAGYQMVDVDSQERAIEIASKISSAPGPGGAPLGQPIEVRQVMGPLPGADL